MFDTVIDERAKRMRLKLVGIMTYYGKHYTTFVYNSKLDTWFYLDDARVKEVKILSCGLTALLSIL